MRMRSSVCGKLLKAILVAVIGILLLDGCSLLKPSGEYRFATEGEYFCEELNCRLICYEDGAWLVLREDFVPVWLEYIGNPNPHMIDALKLTSEEYRSLDPISAGFDRWPNGASLHRGLASASQPCFDREDSFTIDFAAYPGQFSPNKDYRFTKVAEPQGLPFQWTQHLAMPDLNAYRVEGEILIVLDKWEAILRFSEDRTLLANDGEVPLIDRPEISSLPGKTAQEVRAQLGWGYFGVACYPTKDGYLVCVTYQDNIVSQVQVLDLITGKIVEKA